MLMRQLQTPTGPNQEATRVAPISAGGTSATNKRDAVNNLGGISKDEYGQPSGVVQLDAEGKIPSTLLPPLEDFKYSLHGPTVMAHGESAEFYVTNYSHDRPLSVTVSNGASFSLIGREAISVTAPSSGSEFKLTVNNRSTIVKCSRAGALKPHLVFIHSEGKRKMFFASAFRDGPRTYSNWKEVSENEDFVAEGNVSGIWLRGQAYGAMGEVGLLVNGRMHSLNDGDTIRIVDVEPGERIGLRTTQGKPLSYRKIFNTTRHVNTHWQISKDRDFSTTHREYRATAQAKNNLRKWGVELDPGIYYLRFAYNSDTPGVMNEWSDTYTLSVSSKSEEPEGKTHIFHSVIDMLPYPDIDKTDLIDLDRSGDFAVVGNPVNGLVENSFFSFYRRNAVAWNKLQVVYAKDVKKLGEARNEGYGFSKAVRLSANGKTIAVLDTTLRSSENHVTATNQEGLVHGSIYVYKYSGGELVHEKTLHGQENQSCSTRPVLSHDGNAIAYFADNVLNYYTHNGVDWVLNSTYTLPHHDAPWSMAASDDLSVIAVGYMSSNKVVILQRDNSGSYRLRENVFQPQGKTGINFGYSLDLSSDGNTLVVASPVISNTVYGSGVAPSVDVFYREAEFFALKESLVGSPGSMYGKSVSLNFDGKLLAIGAPNTGETEKYNSLVRCGAVYFKNLITGETQSIRRDIEFEETEYGDEVVFDGSTLLVASRKRGSVFVYRKNK